MAIGSSAVSVGLVVVRLLVGVGAGTARDGTKWAVEGLGAVDELLVEGKGLGAD